MSRSATPYIVVLACTAFLVSSAILSLRQDTLTQPQSSLSPTARTEWVTPLQASLNISAPIALDRAERPPDHVEIPSALLAACGEWEPERRAQLIAAALRAWAVQDVHAAGAWVQTQSFLPRAVALAAVVNGAAAGNPAEAERYVAGLSAAEPANAVEYGGFLIFALGEAGEHARAASWATHRAPPQPEWLASAYGRWAHHDARTAWSAANAVQDDHARHLAARAALNSWARSAADQVLEYAQTMPDGPDKTFALVAALRRWAAHEPERAAAWMLKHRDAFSGVPSPEIILED